MLRSVNRECIKRNNYFRVFSTAPVPKVFTFRTFAKRFLVTLKFNKSVLPSNFVFLFIKEAHTIDPTEWNKALPYSQIPGPTAFQLLRNFLPGGMQYFML